MKMLLVYLENEKTVVNNVRSLLEKMGIPVVTFPLEHPEDMDITQFTAFFMYSASSGKKAGEEDKQKTGNPTHVLILSSLNKRWFDFLAGFSFGSNFPIIIYGQDAIAGISKEFASFFTFLKADASLQTFLEAEYEAFKKQEAAREIIQAQETLLRMGIPVTGESLAKCAGEGRVEEVAHFLAAGFSPDTRNKAGVPLLHISARSGNREIIRYLILAGAELNMQSDDRGTSALMDSVMSKHYDLMTDLIQAVADLNIKSKDGQTALVVAVGAGDDQMVEALLRAGADPDISDSLGASARKYANLFNKKNMIDLFNTYAPLKTE